MPRVTVLVFVASLAIPQWAAAQLRAEVFATGLDSPLAFVQDPTQSNVQFIVEQFGRIRIVQNGQLLATNFLDLQGQIAVGGESGLLHHATVRQSQRWRPAFRSRWLSLHRDGRRPTVP